MPARRCAAVAAAILCGSAASAQPLGFLRDKEPTNNFPGGGQLIIRHDTSALTGVLGLTSGDLDLIDVRLDVGSVLTIVTMPLDPSMTQADTVVEVTTSSGTSLALDDDSGSDSTGPPVRGSVVRLRAPASDFYSIRVTGFDAESVGDYAMLISVRPPDPVNALFSADFEEEEPNNSPAAASPLALPWGGPVTGPLSISPSGDHDYFSVELRAGDLLTAVATPIDPAGGATLTVPDTVVTIFAPDGVTALVENDDDTAGEYPLPPAGARGSMVRLRAEVAGVYYIRVRGFGAATGNLMLSMCVLPNRFSICPSDLDGDGVVNATDLAFILGSWGPCP